MAIRRMFSKNVVSSDAFCDMPLSTQGLYFQLCMNADDEGFVPNPKLVMRMFGAQPDELKVLLAKGFLLDMGDGIMVVKHWFQQNTVRKDRFNRTSYTEKEEKLFIKSDGSYTLHGEKGMPLLAWLPDGCQMVAVDKSRVEKNRVDKSRLDKIYINKGNKEIDKSLEGMETNSETEINETETEKTCPTEDDIKRTNDMYDRMIDRYPEGREFYESLRKDYNERNRKSQREDD